MKWMEVKASYALLLDEDQFYYKQRIIMAKATIILSCNDH